MFLLYEQSNLGDENSPKCLVAFISAALFGIEILLFVISGEILGIGELSYTGALSSPPAETSLPDSEVSLRLGLSLSFSVAL